MQVGVLALQGGFAEHVRLLQQLGVQARLVRLPSDLDHLSGLIIPGGESTVMGKLALASGLMEPLRVFAHQHAVWGSCAGAIFMARNVDHAQPVLGLMDIAVERNAFGRQAASFQQALDISRLAPRVDTTLAFPGIFIRAPKIQPLAQSVKVLAELPDGSVVAVRQGKWLATAFHPELTDDARWHDYFLADCRN